MVRLSDLHEAEAEHLQARADAMPRIEPGVWITPKPLAESTIAIVSTAGLHLRSDAPFELGALNYRAVPSNADWGDVVLSHVSTNFDRSASQQDPNISFPAERLREIADVGKIGGVSNWHYSFLLDRCARAQLAPSSTSLNGLAWRARRSASYANRAKPLARLGPSGSR